MSKDLERIEREGTTNTSLLAGMSVGMTNETKQPPQELVDKIKNVKQDIGFGDSFTVDSMFGSKAIDELAQIAVEYAEEEKKNILSPEEWELVIKTLIDRAILIDFDNFDSDEFDDPKAHASWLFTSAEKFKKLFNPRN